VAFVDVCAFEEVRSSCRERFICQSSDFGQAGWWSMGGITTGELDGLAWYLGLWAGEPVS
jgi:hypothetical protein